MAHIVKLTSNAEHSVAFSVKLLHSK